MSNPTTADFDLHPFFEHTPDLVCIVGKDGHFKKVNNSVIEKLRFTEKELFTRPVSDFIHPDDKELTALERTKLLQGHPLISFQNRYIAKNGEILWLDWTSIYFEDQEMVFAIAKDVTERKRVEKEIEKKYAKYKSLARHFKTSMETDRKYLAGELHEEVAQLAAIVKMELNWINTNATALPHVTKERLDHALKVTDLLMSAIQRISFSISPKMLEDLGLDAAVSWLCEEFEVLNNIPCRFESVYNEERLGSEIRLDFFRICQESMRNIMLHAPAKSILISIEEKKDEISLSITVEGINAAALQHANNKLWTGIRERAYLFNGDIKIENINDLQTRLSVTVP